MLRALLLALRVSNAPGHLRICLPDHRTGPSIFLLSKHTYLFYSRRITSFFQSFLKQDDSHKVDFRWYSTKWPSLPGADILDHLTGQAQAAILPHPTLPLPPPPTRKLQAFERWKMDTVAELEEDNDRPPGISIIPPADHTPPPFVQGVLEAKSRRLFSACLQTATGHNFSADYSDRHRQGAGDNTTCPCGARFSTKHLLLRCRLLNLHCHLLHNLPFNLIFRDRIGGKALAAFLLATQVLLRPLPPRPDPP